MHRRMPLQSLIAMELAEAERPCGKFTRLPLVGSAVPSPAPYPDPRLDMMWFSRH
jgi:hypothetical protein